MRSHPLVVVLVAWAGCVGAIGLASAQPPADAKAKQRAEFADKADALIRAGKFAEAVEPAASCVTLSKGVDGAKHWRTFDAGQRVKLAETAKGFGAEKQKKLLEAFAAEEQAKKAEATKPAEALKLAEAARDGYRDVLGDETLEVARMWHLIGRIRYSGNDAKGAKEANEAAVKIRQKIMPEVHPDQGRSQNNLGIAQFALGDKKAAVASYREAIRIWKASLGEIEPLVAMGLFNLGVVQCELRDYKAAEKNYTEALGIRRKTLPKDHADISQNLQSLGIVQYDLREFESAKRSHAEALAIRQNVLSKDKISIAQSLHFLGGAQWELREYEAARQSQTEALAIRRKSLPQNHPDIARSLNNLGIVQWSVREYEAAVRSHVEALAIRRKILPNDQSDISESLTNLGVVQDDLREFEAAKRSHAEALAIRRKGLPEDQPGIAQSLHNLCMAQFSLREYEAAKQNQSEALAIQRKFLRPDHPDIAKSLNNLGVVQRELSDYAAAEASYSEALAIERKVLPNDHPDIARSLANLGNIQWSLRAYASAKKSYTEALAIRRKALPEGHPDIALSLNNLGSMQRQFGEFEAARRSHAEALAIRRKALPEKHPDIAQSLMNIGSLDLCAGTVSDQTVVTLESALAIHLVDLTRLASSQAEAEQLRGAEAAQNTLGFYLSAVTVRGREASATYRHLAIHKGAVTARQRWTRELRDPKDAVTADLLRKLTALDRELLGASLPDTSGQRLRDVEPPRRTPAELQEARKELERQLLAKAEAYRLFQAKARIGGDEVRAALPVGTVLIDFREYTHFGPPLKGAKDPIIEQRLIAFVVPPGAGAVALVPLGEAGPVTKAVERWRATYGVGKVPAAGDADPAAELRTLVWEPIAKHLGPAVTTVLVSPDGPLHGVPFAALPGSKPGTYLLHEYAFATVPVPVLLPEMMERKPARPQAASLLLMGGIDFGAGQEQPAGDRAGKLPPVPQFLKLAGTDSEVNDLRAQFEDAFPDAPAPQVFKKDRATKVAFLENAPRHPYLHLATHGFFAAETEKSALDAGDRGLRNFTMDRVTVGRNPALLSGVVFAGVNRTDRPKEDGVLTALEAGELDLSRTELVVLSACETGRGRVAGGEGVLGLQRAFQVAGARTALASLWQVPDEETHQLMREFYRRLWDAKTPVSRAAALRQAQLWMLDNAKRSGIQLPEAKPGVPPHVWAAFVLSGDWR